MICAIKSAAWTGVNSYATMGQIQSTIRAGESVCDLATIAFVAADGCPTSGVALHWSEAESLLRTGFVPDGWRDA